MRNGILGIDCGTSKIAAALIDPEEYELLGAGSSETGADLVGGPPSRREQNVAAIEQALRRVVTEVLSSRKIRLRSIGITGQMHGILGLDGSGKPVTDYVTWEDGRGEEELASGVTLLQEIRQRAGEQTPIASGYGIVTLYHWLKYGRPSGLAKVCNIADYLGMLLTENTDPVTDYTVADSFGVFDIASRGWNQDVLDNLDIPTTLLPRLLPPTEVSGEARAGWICDLAGSSSVPVCVAIGDNQASYLGSVREHCDSLLINIGTGSQICFAERDKLKESIRSSIDGRDVTLRPFVGSAFLVAGSALAGGVVYRALKDFFAAVGRDLYGVDEPTDLYQAMGHLAESVEGAAGLDIKPVFRGTRSDPECRGRIEGISFDNFSPGRLTYAMQEGMVRILKELLDPEMIAGKDLLIGSGNGLRRNPLLQKITASLFERELLLPELEEEAAIGAALNGAVAAEIYSTFEEAKEVIRYQKVVST